MNISFDEILKMVHDSVSDTIAPILAENQMLRAIIDSFDSAPAQMTTPIGVLPINSTGMRELGDAYSRLLTANTEDLTDAAHKIASYFNVCIFEKDGSVRALSDILNDIADNWLKTRATTYWCGAPIEKYSSLIVDEKTWFDIKFTDNYSVNYKHSLIDVPYRVIVVEVVNDLTGDSVIILIKIDISVKKSSLYS